MCGNSNHFSGVDPYYLVSIDRFRETNFASRNDFELKAADIETRVRLSRQKLQTYIAIRINPRMRSTKLNHSGFNVASLPFDIEHTLPGLKDKVSRLCELC